MRELDPHLALLLHERMAVTGGFEVLFKHDSAPRADSDVEVLTVSRLQNCTYLHLPDLKKVSS
jgi:hypothetical protein